MQSKKKESTWERLARQCREKKATGATPAAPKVRSPRAAPARADKGADESVVSEVASVTAFSLDSSLQHAAAAPLAKGLLALRGRPAVVDASQVQRLGAQCVQVLLSAAKLWKADNQDFSLVDCSSAMLDDLRLLGFEPQVFSVRAQ